MDDAVQTLDTISLPDKAFQRRYAALIGLDDHKSRLTKQLALIFKPSTADSWIREHGNGGLVQLLRGRPPLFVLAGDVGCGKTELGETLGDAVARDLGISVKLYRLALSSRGSGLHGEMTKLITSAFAQVRAEARTWRDSKGDARTGAILFIDEADSLAQSREIAEMHHEDRVGVNALIRGINDLGDSPVAVIMATNRSASLDPAVVRRAADIIMFDRPDETQRAQILSEVLSPPLQKTAIDQLVRDTGPNATREYGYTFSDLRQRLLPNIAIAALPKSPIDAGLVERVLKQTPPTKPFRSAER